jgi:hypothetical protein
VLLDVLPLTKRPILLWVLALPTSISRVLETQASSHTLSSMEGMERADRRAAVLLTAPLDRWIALSEDESRIVAVGSTFEEAVREAERAGVSDPIIVKTPPDDWTPRVLLVQRARA